MLLVCKNEYGATIYTMDGSFDVQNAVEIGSICDTTPMWAIEEGDESQNDWACYFDTKDRYCSADNLDDCIDAFVKKAAHGYDVPMVVNGSFDEYRDEMVREYGSCD